MVSYSWERSDLANENTFTKAADQTMVRPTPTHLTVFRVWCVWFRVRLNWKRGVEVRGRNDVGLAKAVVERCCLSSIKGRVASE